MTNQKKKNIPESTTVNENDGLGCSGFVIVLLLIYGGFFLLDKFIFNIKPFDNFNENISKKVSGLFNNYTNHDVNTKSQSSSIKLVLK